jgi:hypothetical protein
VIERLDAAGADPVAPLTRGCQSRDLIRFFAKNRISVIEAMHAARTGGVSARPDQLVPPGAPADRHGRERG